MTANKIINKMVFDYIKENGLEGIVELKENDEVQFVRTAFENSDHSWVTMFVHTDDVIVSFQYGYKDECEIIIRDRFPNNGYHSFRCNWSEIQLSIINWLNDHFKDETKKTVIKSGTEGEMKIETTWNFILTPKHNFYKPYCNYD